MFATIEQLQSMLWITNPTAQQTTKMTIILEASWEILTWLIWDVSEQVRTEYFNPCDIKWRGCVCWNSEILVQHLNVTSLNFVNWTAYTWVLWTDYRIQSPNNRLIVVNNLFTYVNNTNFCDLEIKYTAWWTEENAPKDIAYAQLLIAISERSKDAWMTVQSYQLRDRKVSFALDKDTFNSLQKIIDKYTILSLYTVGI